MCNRYPCDKSLVDLLLLCCCMQQQKGGGLCFVCNMPRPRGDHPHGKPGGRVSMVVNADHMQVTCRHAITCRSHACHSSTDYIPHFLFPFLSQTPFVFQLQTYSVLEFESRNGKSKKVGRQ